MKEELKSYWENKVLNRKAYNELCNKYVPKGSPNKVELHLLMAIKYLIHEYCYCSYGNAIHGLKEPNVWCNFIEIIEENVKCYSIMKEIRNIINKKNDRAFNNEEQQHYIAMFDKVILYIIHKSRKEKIEKLMRNIKNSKR